MNKLFLVLVFGLILTTPLILAKDIEVIIEHKNIKTQISQIKTMSYSGEIQEIGPQSRYEIKTISKEEFEQLKKDNSILIQENIPKYILMNASVPLIEADSVWDIQENLTNITGEGQTVCILDTGAQTNHPALIGKNATCNIDCATTPGTCIENCSTTDPHGHGTHVAGTIVSTHATYHGVTQNTQYIPVMVCDFAGYCPNQAVLDGLDWCIANKDTYNISIISMSLGGGQHSSYCDASYPSDTTRINNATINNITVVTATGNLVFNSPILNITNHSAGISSPACIQNAIRIGNTDDADNMADSGLRHNFFSDIITAPGVEIISTIPTSTTGSSSGTSMSTPHVSGVIALLNHYKKLESNTILTPSTIKQFILDSGKTIYDADTNQNFTRVNAYQTILYSDEQLPSTQPLTPTSPLFTNPGNITFQCNASDNLQLKNLTLKIYNSTELIYNITNSSPINNILTINSTVNISQIENYNWTCISYDNQSNFNITENRTISTHSVQIQIISPQNDTYTNQNQTIINCSVQSLEELSNITFSIYNQTHLLNFTTRNITGTINYSIFNYTFPNETNYYYNCLAINNQSQQAQTQNYTITYDKTSPQITLTSPTNNTNTTTKSHTFVYSETETNKDFCNLTINNQNYSTFSQTLTDGTYYWNITCTDKANNTNISQTYKLDIYTVPTPPSPSSGGGGSSAPRIYELKEEETKQPQGAQQKLREKDSVKFKTKSQDHKLTLNKIEDNKVNVTIESDPINLILYLNSPTKLNLDNDETFDLELTLLYTNDYANIIIKEINETIPVKKIFTPIQNETKEEINEESPEEKLSLIGKIIAKFTAKENRKFSFIFASIAILVFTAIILELIKSKKIKHLEAHHNIGKHRKARHIFISIQRVPIKNIRYNKSKKIKTYKSSR
ncbi:S8 family serine peptidase [Candidatus Pacearchaeota archaeon]|nr:S8 family serine peptidase [Candidatus Pacearchaeota archaeon]